MRVVHDVDMIADLEERLFEGLGMSREMLATLADEVT